MSLSVSVAWSLGMHGWARWCGLLFLDNLMLPFPPFSVHILKVSTDPAIAVCSEI